MSIPESINLKNNYFRAEDLARHDTIFAPQNSPITEAIKAIKQFIHNPFVDNPTMRKITTKRFEILKTLDPVQYDTQEEWAVTFADVIVLIKYPGKKNASINMNINEDATPLPAPRQSLLSNCSIQ